MVYKAWKVELTDNVAVVIQDIIKGNEIEVGNKKIKANEDIQKGHKIAITDIPKGEMIRKYGFPIGESKEDIKIGDYVHTNNIVDITGKLCEKYFKEYVSKGDK